MKTNRSFKITYPLLGLVGIVVLVFGIIKLPSIFLERQVSATLPTSPVIEDSVTITFAAESAAKPIYQELMEAFQTEYPNIRVQLVEMDHSSQIDLPTQASLADTSFLLGRTAVISGEAYFRDLTPLLENDPRFEPADFWPNALTGCQDQEGRSLGVPINLYVLGILYDPSVLDIDGLTHPQPGWTWDDFKQLVTSQTLSGQYSFVDLPVTQTTATTYLLAPLVDAYLAKQNGTVDPETFAPAVQWYLDLVREKHLFPVTEMDQSETYRALMQDGDPPLMIGAINSQLRDGTYALSKYSLVPFPIQSTAEGSATTPIIASCGVISAGSNHPQEAWLWLDYLSHQWIHGDERFAYINQAVPARSSVASSTPYWKTIPANAQEAYSYGLEHGWYGSAYPEPLWAVTQAIIESTDRGTPLANALQSKLAELSTNSSSTKPGEPIVIATPRVDSVDSATIRFYSNQVFEDAGKYEHLVEGFHRDHPEIEIEVSSPLNPADFPGGEDDLFYFPAENYDCFELNLPDFSLKDLSVVRDVNTLIDQDATLRADFFPGQLDAYTVDGHMYGLPASISPNLMFYNKTLLNQLGIALPKNDWTFDDFIQTATAASTTLDGQKVYGFAPYTNRDVGLLLAGRGVEWVDLSSTFPKAYLNDPEVIDVFRWIDGLRQSGVLLPTTLMDSSEAIQSALAAGQLAFWTAESTSWGGWYFNSMESIPYEIGAVPLPKTPALNTADNPLMTGLFISSKSQNTQACWDWMRYLSEQPAALRGVPARRSIASSPVWEAVAGAEEATIYRDALEQNDGALRPTSWETRILTNMFSFGSGALGEIFAGNEVGVALSTAQRKADFVSQCLEEVGYLNLPAADREGVVNTCLQQANTP